jgi:hypothetical protein
MSDSRQGTIATQSGVSWWFGKKLEAVISTCGRAASSSTFLMPIGRLDTTVLRAPCRDAHNVLSETSVDHLRGRSPAWGTLPAFAGQRSAADHHLFVAG